MNKLWALLVIFGCIVALDGTDSVDSEDVNVIQALLEEQEIHELAVMKEQTRLRLIPATNKESVFYRSLISWSGWQAGLRVDHIPGSDRTQLSKMFLKRDGTKKKILLGNLKIERGLGLLFGSNYGRLGSVITPLSFTENRERIGFDLTSYANAGVLGSLIEIKSSSMTHFILFGSCPLGVKKREFGEGLAISNGSSRTVERYLASYLLARDSEKGHYGISVVGEHLSKIVEDKRSNISFSIFAEENLSHFRVVGEGVLSGQGQAFILNLTYRSAAFSWFLHQRYFSTHYHPLAGSPYADFGDGSNETGWIAGTKYRSDRVTLSTWLGFSNQLVEAGEHLRNKGYDRQIYVRLAKFLKGTLELRFRQREKFYLQHSVQAEIEHEYWSPVHREYSTVTYTGNNKGNFRLKVSMIRYRPYIEENETGTLISFLFPAVSWKLLKAHYGLHLFHTDGWDSRLYDYEYSLPGEFRLVPFYETGAEAYGTCKIKLNRGVDLGMRFSYEWKTNPNYNHVPDIAFQVDIHR